MNIDFAFRYLKYFFKAGSRHDVHSPFVYDLVTKVIPDKWSADFNSLESLREKMLKDQSIVPTEDFGAGHRGNGKHNRTISFITRNSSRQQKYCRLLYRIVCFYKPAIMIELGTAIGMSALYLGKGNPSGKLFTVEGNRALAEIAQRNIAAENLHNITVVAGGFDEKLTEILKQISQLDFIYIDGNHRLEATMDYFNRCMEKSHKNTIFVFDDINWNKEMQEAWMTIKKHPKVTVTVDLFMMGLVFLNPDLSKQDYVTRY